MSCSTSLVREKTMHWKRFWKDWEKKVTKTEHKRWILTSREQKESFLEKKRKRKRNKVAKIRRYSTLKKLDSIMKSNKCIYWSYIYSETIEKSVLIVFENAFIWKRSSECGHLNTQSPTVLVWTAETDPSKTLTSFKSRIASASFCRMRRWLFRATFSSWAY